jgi:precorrin-3B synthase
MQTGDGLLARLIPSGTTIGLDAFAALCRAACGHGNGVIEITSRGSIQVRGLSPATTPMFAAAVEPLGIDCGDTIPVLTNPLSGLGAHDERDVTGLADALRAALAETSAVSRLSAKVSVIIDGGSDSGLHLDDISADVRLRAGPDGLFDVSLAGDAATATPLSAVTAESAASCVVKLLDLLACRFPRGRMKALVDADGAASIAATVSDYLSPRPPSSPRIPAQPIGVHALHGGRVAVGIGLPFGHSEAGTMEALLELANRQGVSGVRTAPGRVLLLVGAPPASVDRLWAQAVSLGFVIDPRDPRRQVVACPGSPICASGQIPARALAPVVAQAAGLAAHLGSGEVIHVSGCSKGCAHPSPSAVTIVGTAGMCDVQVDGVSSGVVTTGDLPLRIPALLQSRKAVRG